MWPFQLAFHHFTVGRLFLFYLTLCNTSLFLNDRSTWPPLAFSSNTFQHFPSIYDPFSEVYRFQRHTKLCAKYTTLLVPSFNITPFSWWKESSC
jgi:hypothetical protein